MDDDAIPYVRPRIANACDGCKARKVKCDGDLPCSYCVRRRRGHACTYSPQKRRRLRESAVRTPVSRHHSGSRTGDQSPAHHEEAETPSHRPQLADNGVRSRNGVRQATEVSAEDDTEVPREARLVCDAQGKLIFIGDCAPLSFFQSIRQVVTSRVETNAFAPESSRFSVLEVASSQQHSRSTSQGSPSIWPNTVPEAVCRYQSTTSGVLDLFDNERLLEDVQLWASLDRKPQSSTSIINYLILAIGLRTSDDAKAEEYFEYSLSRALTGLSNTLSVATVQAFALITMYMLCTCQINGAFLYFGIAVRAAYTVGIHRSEVNARFGPEIHAQRDRLWKSLRIVDLYLSTSMGRPPATSDVDCSVPYKATGPDGVETYDLLNASVQILLITERIVEEIYSRKKISLQLTEGISVQLREWSATWLQRLKRSEPDAAWNIKYNGACQIMSTYYYAVMLVSRPFLMYELYRNLDGPQASGRLSLATGKSKLADACIDSASLMVESIQDGISHSTFTGLSRTNSCMPLLVPWLFASSLVLGVGLLGGFGRVLEKRCRQSIEALDHFARHDAHAEQYSLIAQSLLSVSLEHLEKKELSERMQRTESSSQLFGLLPSRRPSLASPNPDGTAHQAPTPAGMVTRGRDIPGRDIPQDGALLSINSPGLGEVDSAFLGLTDNGLHPTDGGYWGAAVGSDADQASALNLFTLLDSGGGIDLAHYL